MENYFIPKEEYIKQEDNDIDYGNGHSIIKKEEDINLKVEEKNYHYPFHEENQMTVPWTWNYSDFSQHSSMIQHQNQTHFAKPFIIIRNSRNVASGTKNECNDSLFNSNIFIKVKIEQTNTEKKANQVKFCKNYVGLICSGFARTLLKAKPGQPLFSFIKETLMKRKVEFGCLKNQEYEKLREAFMNHITKKMCGKKVRKVNCEKDFKIRNIKDLQNLWKILDKDSELTRLKKGSLKEVLEYFFESNYYFEWLENGMMTQANKSFFLSNKKEIQNKILYPGVYKPKFNRSLD